MTDMTEHYNDRFHVVSVQTEENEFLLDSEHDPCLCVSTYCDQYSSDAGGTLKVTDMTMLLCIRDEVQRCWSWISVNKSSC